LYVEGRTRIAAFTMSITSEHRLKFNWALCNSFDWSGGAKMLSCIFWKYISIQETFLINTFIWILWLLFKSSTIRINFPTELFVGRKTICKLLQFWILLLVQSQNFIQGPSSAQTHENMWYIVLLFTTHSDLFVGSSSDRRLWGLSRIQGVNVNLY
jgi:hypothetical protein